MDLTLLSPLELLKLQAQATQELRQRNIVRTLNNPLGDYAEWLVSNALGLKLANNSSSGYDAIDDEGNKFQIKAWRVTLNNPSKQLSAIRSLQAKDFDTLIAVIFNEHFDLLESFAIPHEVIDELATYRQHVNAHILQLHLLRVRNDPRIINITEKLASLHHTSYLK
jgi:hypothetical protein